MCIYVTMQIRKLLLVAIKLKHLGETNKLLTLIYLKNRKKEDNPMNY